MDNAARAAILQEIIELSIPPPRRADEILLNEYMAETGVSETTARRQLMAAVAAGKLETETRLIDGHYRRVWRKAK